MLAAYTNTDLTSKTYSLRMMRQAAGSNEWVDTPDSRLEPQASAAQAAGTPVPTATGMGIVYTLDQTLYWAAQQLVPRESGVSLFRI